MTGIGGMVAIDLGDDGDGGADLQRLDRHRLDVLHRVPDGATVVVDIGARKWISQDAAAWLHQHRDRLCITIVGSEPEAVHRFVTAARTGVWGLVG